MNKDFQIEVWYRPGNGMMVRCDSLSMLHPKHPFNQVVEQGGHPSEFSAFDRKEVFSWQYLTDYKLWCEVHDVPFRHIEEAY